MGTVCAGKSLKVSPIVDEKFLSGKRVLAALKKIGCSYLKQEFQRDARGFLEEFTNFVHSTVAARSKTGQGLSRFCPAIVIGGDGHTPLHLLGFLLDGLLERGWIKGKEIEACRAECQSFVQEQRQLERSSTRIRPEVGDILSFCSSQTGFHARQHLSKVCIATNMVKPCGRLGQKRIVLFFQMFQLTAFIVHGLVTTGERFIINIERVMICEDEVRGALLCVQDFVSSPHFTQRNFFSDSGIAMLAESAAICDSVTTSEVFERWSHVETASRSQVVTEVCACVNQAVDRRRAVKVSQGQWYAVGGIRPSSEDSNSRSGVRISNIVEEGRVENVPVSVPSFSNPGPSNLRVCSGKSKKRKNSRTTLKNPSKLQIPSSSQRHGVVEGFGFSAALDRQQSCRKARRSGRNRRAAPVFQGGLP